MIRKFNENPEELSYDDLVKEYKKLLDWYRIQEKEMDRFREDINFMNRAIENIPNAFIIKDNRGNIYATSEELGNMFGDNIRLISGRASLEMDRFFPREECIKFQEEDMELLETQDIKHYEMDFKFHDGQMHPCFYWSKGFDVPDNNIKDGKEHLDRGIVTEFVDMTKEKQLEAELELASQTDPGTGLFNRYVFDKQTKDIISDARTNGTPVCVMMCDLDHFKRVNDTFGHLEGDRVLMDFANIIKSQIRSVDVPIRYGGEEFLIFLPGTDITHAKVVAERLREITEEKMILPDDSVITVSIGLVSFDVNESRQQCIERADEALYTAKETGRNKVVIFADKSKKYLG